MSGRGETVTRAALLNQAGRFDAAQPLLYQALASRPNDQDALHELARSMSGLQRYRDLLDVAGRLAAAAPESPLGHFWAAQAYYSLKCYPESLDAALRMVALNPNFDLAHQQVAWASAKLPKSQRPPGVDPVTAARQAVRLDPLDPDNHACLGTMLMPSRRHRREAERAFLEALRLDPDHSMALNNRGVLHKSLWRFGSVASMFTRSAADPDVPQARSNLKGLLFSRTLILSFLLGLLWGPVVAVSALEPVNWPARGGLLAVLALLGAAPVIIVRRLDAHTRRVLGSLVRGSGWLMGLFGVIGLIACGAVVTLLAPPFFSVPGAEETVAALRAASMVAIVVWLIARGIKH